MRNVIVTGGSRGLGLAVVRRLASTGYRALAIARTTSSPELARIAGEPDHFRPGSFQFVPFDLSEIDKIPELIRSLHKDFGPIYGLINNAASGAHGALGMMPNCDIEDQIRLNVLSPIAITKYVVRHMMADGGGRIVNVASVVAFSGYSGLSVYAATKSSMIGFTRSLAREVGRLGVNVNAVAPGFMETAMTQEMDSKLREQIVRRTALGRFADVEDVVDAIEFLMGDKAKNITGAVLTVDAGTTA
jgi:3-oxoacyl-[acyl-carrier protein] reductase